MEAISPKSMGNSSEEINEGLELSVDYLTLALATDEECGEEEHDTSSILTPLKVIGSSTLDGGIQSAEEGSENDSQHVTFASPSAPDNISTPASRRKKPKSVESKVSSPVTRKDNRNKPDSITEKLKQLRCSRIIYELSKTTNKIVRENLKSFSHSIAILGLILAFTMEVFPNSPRYNAALMVVLTCFRHMNFPRKSMRSQIVMVLTTLFSIPIDIIYMITWNHAIVEVPSVVSLQVLLPFVLFGKCVALITFLRKAPGTRRARRYLARRFRLFIIPFSEPRRIMRDIRGRVLAIGWIHAIAIIAYITLFIVSIAAFSYSQLFVATTLGVSLSGFLVGKAVTSAIILLGVLYDTDIVLCLAYFGCLAFTMGMAFVKNYTRRKKEELGGWPHAFSFNFTRFRLLAFLKAADWGIGLLGWVNLSRLFGISFFSQPDALQAFISLILLTLTIADWWVWSLFGGVFWLHGRYMEANLTGDLESSDDSELDDLGVRGTLTSPVRKPKTKRNRERERYMAEHGQEHEFQVTNSITKKVRNFLGNKVFTHGRDVEESVQANTPLRQRKNGDSPYRNSTHSQHEDDDEEEDDDDDDSSDGGSGSGSGSSSYNGSSDSEGDDDDDPEDNNVLSKLSPKTRNSATKTLAHQVAHQGMSKEGVAQMAPIAVHANKDSFATTRREAERRHSLSSVTANLEPASPTLYNPEHSREASLRPSNTAVAGPNGGGSRTRLPPLPSNTSASKAVSTNNKKQKVQDERFASTRHREAGTGAGGGGKAFTSPKDK